MAWTMKRFVSVVVIPAAVFQAVIFGGAYGTGREVAEFISSLGPVGGLLALALAGFGWGLTMALSFELARLTKSYDYRGFLKVLVGPGWIAFEILFLMSLLIVIAVNGAAAGDVLFDQYGIPRLAGVALLFITVVALNFFGQKFLQESMSVCMIALVVVLLIYSVLALNLFHGPIAQTFRTAPLSGNWFVSGMQYMLYTAAVVPVLLYSARDIETRSEAVVSAFTAGFLGVFPAAVFHITFMADYPASLQQPLPTYWMLGKLAQPWLMMVYIIVLFAMIIQTCAGLLQGVNERLDAWTLERSGHKCHPRTHAIVAGAAMLVSLLLSTFGITALVAKGYGSVAWGYLVVFFGPLLTIGVFKLFFARRP